ncbi:MAG: GntR family transcriptional regulator [Planctomycetota bacterium]|jgi:DNA-binding LacI/PurR family transcriptional regulator
MITSKHNSLYDTILGRIQDGSYTDRLPTQKEMADEFEVNFKTVAKALKALSDNGVIQSKPGLGSFIRRKQPTGTMPLLNMVPLESNALDESNPYRDYASNFLNSLWLNAAQKGIHIALLPEINEGNISTMQPAEGEYAVIFGIRKPNLITAVHNLGYRVIVLGCSREHVDIYRNLPFMAITRNMEHSYELMVNHLKKKGRKKIALLYFDSEKSWNKHEIMTGLCLRHDLEFESERVIADKDRLTLNAIDTLLERDVEFDSVIVPHNECARILIEKLTARGYKIPEDISVICDMGNYSGQSFNNHNYTHTPT